MSGPGKAAPGWARAPFEQLIEGGERLQQMVHLAMRGISMVQSAPKMVEALASIQDNSDAPETGQRLERAREEADLAQREVREGFPLLHAQAVVTLWTLLEACVRKVLGEWLLNEPRVLQNAVFEKVNVRLAEYERLEKADRMLYVADALEREIGARMQPGVGRFEPLLKALDLGGEIPAALRREVLELSQVRNVIVHRGGIVDRRLTEVCPWLQVTLGERLLVSHTMFGHYTHATQGYAVVLMCRVGEHFGVDMSKQRREVFEAYSQQEHTKKTGF